MSIGWPTAFVLCAVILGIVSLIATILASRGSVQTEEAKGKYGEQYRMLADDYAKLAEETRTAQSTMQADLAAVRASVESIEQMMRDVG